MLFAAGGNSMNGPEKTIVRCEQNGTHVDVYGRFAVEGPERVRVLFSVPGRLQSHTDKRVRIVNPKGEQQEWTEEQQLVLQPETMESMVDDLMNGGQGIVARIVFICIVIAIALALGQINDEELYGNYDEQAQME